MSDAVTFLETACASTESTKDELLAVMESHSDNITALIRLQLIFLFPNETDPDSLAVTLSRHFQFGCSSTQCSQHIPRTKEDKTHDGIRDSPGRVPMLRGRMT